MPWFHLTMLLENFFSKECSRNYNRVSAGKSFFSDRETMRFAVFSSA